MSDSSLGSYRPDGSHPQAGWSPIPGMNESNLISLVRKWKEARATVRAMAMGDVDPLLIREAQHELSTAAQELAGWKP